MRGRTTSSINGTTALVTKNTIAGNDPVDNYGLQNGSGEPSDPAKNFWGDPGGPGADPAAAVCETRTGSVTTVDPVATKPGRVRGRPLF